MTPDITTSWCRATRYGWSRNTSLRCLALGAQQTLRQCFTRHGITAGAATTPGITRGGVIRTTRGTIGIGTSATAEVGA